MTYFRIPLISSSLDGTTWNCCYERCCWCPWDLSSLFATPGGQGCLHTLVSAIIRGPRCSFSRFQHNTGRGADSMRVTGENFGTVHSVHFHQSAETLVRNPLWWCLAKLWEQGHPESWGPTFPNKPAGAGPAGSQMANHCPSGPGGQSVKAKRINLRR